MNIDELIVDEMKSMMNINMCKASVCALHAYSLAISIQSRSRVLATGFQVVSADQ